ncbi:SMP-30/gluconolactonase/LRE family protein [Paracoccus sp. S-4012]|uniref:SMP-30/gluconolactonase/LRE family protein n=1 Tax=Paracoccus sp. S-4012 TaxID=2665648 RepID=UPI0012AF0076|nr:SMP-30/gluconolactonase/LRE family protein [Paracoccus sp. S-4012]MRX52253.1 SMP-30/gluconolactonase/LRE family protein [Paracoccus sp. S-4012]
MRAEQITGQVAYHAEGPVWWPGWGGLRWVDMLAGTVLHLDEEGRVHRRELGGVVAALRPRKVGGAVFGVERGFALEDPNGHVRRLPALWDDEGDGRGLRMNEGACDPQGRFLCGSMAYDKRPGAGALYRLDPDGGVETVLDRVTISNGLDWSPDGSHAYHNDTETMQVAVFDSPDGGLSERRVFVDLSDEKLRPDGLTVDAEGHVWIALSNGGQVRRYTPEGRLDGVLELPTPKVTACTFGGPDLDRLYITTSRENQPDDGIAGALFRADIGVRGQPARCFAG